MIDIVVAKDVIVIILDRIQFYYGRDARRYCPSSSSGSRSSVNGGVPYSDGLSISSCDYVDNLA